MPKCKNQVYPGFESVCLYCSTICWHLHKATKPPEPRRTATLASKGKSHRAELNHLSLVTTPVIKKGQTFNPLHRLQIYLKFLKLSQLLHSFAFMAIFIAHDFCKGSFSHQVNIQKIIYWFYRNKNGFHSCVALNYWNLMKSVYIRVS